MTYSAKTLERITGYSSSSVQKFEQRGIYTCELRRRGEFNLDPGILQSPNNPQVRADARTTLAKLNTGWRAYVYEDFVRLLIIRRLFESGVSLKIAAHIALLVTLRPSEFDERELARIEAEGTGPDEIIFYRPLSPNIGHCQTRGVDRLAKAIQGGFPLIIISLTAIRAEVFKHLPLAAVGETE